MAPNLNPSPPPTEKKHERENGKLRVAHRNEMQSIDVQMSMLRREADQRAAAQKEADSLKRDLSSYRNNVKLARFQSAELRAEIAVKETNELRTWMYYSFTINYY